jgi:hypothetical protein
MESGVTGFPARRPFGPHRIPGAASLVVPALLGLVVAGCGGSKAPAVARLATTTPTAETQVSFLKARIRWAECIRAHGVPNFPDPNSQGGVDIAGVDISSPQFLAAHSACAGLEVPLPPAQLARQVKQELAVARCMRRHGVENFPDPTSDGRTAADWQSVTSTPLGAKAARICNPGTG